MRSLRVLLLRRSINHSLGLGVTKWHFQTQRDTKFSGCTSDTEMCLQERLFFPMIYPFQNKKKLVINSSEMSVRKCCSFSWRSDKAHSWFLTFIHQSQLGGGGWCILLVLAHVWLCAEQFHTDVQTMNATLQQNKMKSPAHTPSHAAHTLPSAWVTFMKSALFKQQMLRSHFDSKFLASWLVSPGGGIVCIHSWRIWDPGSSPCCLHKLGPQSCIASHCAVGQESWPFIFLTAKSSTVQKLACILRGGLYLGSL